MDQQLTDPALERLHLLKKDASQIGQNARKAVKFLDQVTSTADLAHDPVTIQGPDDQFTKWAEVEARYTDAIILREESENLIKTEDEVVTASADGTKEASASPERLLQDLSLSSEDMKTSPVSTPPLSPTNSEPQSNKTSPEARCATMAKRDATPVPPSLKPLINFVVYYNDQNKDAKGKEVTFLTNSADASQIAKDFGVVTKTIHQLRASLPTQQGQDSQADPIKHKKKPSNRTSSFKEDSKPKTLFSYDEGSSEDEQLVFKPRPRDTARPTSSGRGGANVPFRGRGTMHSPSNSVNNPATPKPQVPVEEIDPDSFDRGTFARGSTPLANVGNHYGPPPNVNNGFSRGGQRNLSSPMPRGGGGNGYRGNTFRGRGRGRLFVP